MRGLLGLDTPVGPARAFVHQAARAHTTLVLGHGAGRGSDTLDLMALANGLPARGVGVIRVDQPWVVAGRRLAPAPRTLDRAWLAIVPSLPVVGRLVVGGRSAGARVACRTAVALDAAACLALSFPLRPPGERSASRLSELEAAGVPTLVVQGDRDPFGTAADFPPGRGGSYVVQEVPGNHGFEVERRRADLDPPARILHVVSAWLDGRPGSGAS